MNENRTKTTVYIWLIMLVLVAFPLYWTMASQNFSPYATATVVETDGAMMIPDVHPAAPNRLERFGTDGVGRSVATLLSHSAPITLALAATAALLRAGIGTLTAGLFAKRKVPWALLFALQIALYAFALRIPYFKEGTPASLFFPLAILFGLYFPTAALRSATLQSEHKDPLRSAVLSWIAETGQILILFAILGLVDIRIGANPYLSLPALPKLSLYTHPLLINQIAEFYSYGLSAPWTWVIPLIFTLWVAGLFLWVYRMMRAHFARRGVLLSEGLRSLLNFFNPVAIADELRHFSEHAIRLIMRAVIFGILALFIVLGKPEASPVPRDFVIPALDSAPTAALTTPQSRIEHAAGFFRDEKLNVVHEQFLESIDTPEGPRPIAAASLLGKSRAQPILYVFDVNASAETYDFQLALIKGIIQAARTKGFEQSFIFAFVEAVPGTQYLQYFDSYVLRTPQRAIFVTLPEVSGAKIHMDETLLLPLSGWGAQVGTGFRSSIDPVEDVEITAFDDPDVIAKDLAAQGLMGIQMRAVPSDTTSTQDLLGGLLEGNLRFAYRKAR